MARWKMGPQGGYYDPNDTGPDQYQPTPQERASVGGDGQPGQMSPSGAPYGSEGSGGLSGRGGQPGFPGLGTATGWGAGGTPPPWQVPPAIAKDPTTGGMYDPARGGRRVDPGMGRIYDSGLKPPADYWTTPIDWNDPASQWGGWTNPDGSPVDPNNPRAGANPPPSGTPPASLGWGQAGPQTPWQGGTLPSPAMGGWFEWLNRYNNGNTGITGGRPAGYGLGSLSSIFGVR